LWDRCTILSIIIAIKAKHIIHIAIHIITTQVVPGIHTDITTGIHTIIIAITGGIGKPYQKRITLTSSGNGSILDTNVVSPRSRYGSRDAASAVGIQF
jgi:hypothetical protein